MTTEEISAREAVRDLTIRYCFTADAGDAGGWAGCFTEDALVDFGPIGRVHGRAAIRDLFGPIQRTWSFMFHQVTNHRIELEAPDRALGLCYFDFRGVHEGEAWVGNGTYADRFRVESGEWRIAETREEAEPRGSDPDVRGDGIWDFLLVAPPLCITGGCGSPVNPIAIK